MEFESSGLGWVSASHSSLFFSHQERHLALFSYLLYLWDTDVAGSMVSAALSTLLFWFNLSGCEVVTKVFPILWVFKNVYLAVLILDVQFLCRCWSMSSLYCHLFVFLKMWFFLILSPILPAFFKVPLGLVNLLLRTSIQLAASEQKIWLLFGWAVSFFFLRVYHLYLSWLDLPPMQSSTHSFRIEAVTTGNWMGSWDVYLLWFGRLDLSNFPLYVCTHFWFVFGFLVSIDHWFGQCLIPSFIGPCVVMKFRAMGSLDCAHHI